MKAVKPASNPEKGVRLRHSLSTGSRRKCIEFILQLAHRESGYHQGSAQAVFNLRSARKTWRG